ncbi:DNA polymerase III subunits gamma and tau [Methylophaga thiooxydans]|uniref:DNA polymerase III subunit gamma/tau n=1 Tax=Methylophaga thiooxydans TaxID=392484 RepID=A0A0A0BFJ2_9GAMM|nr:DNA polymerase III subunit gamma/tau [Methylophaga thiooxydans]KGM06457.1 DNA polymerase III subunits gamma and tau [Methylophaga thiooxydans]
MSYLVLARKWRPKSFEEVVGQQHVLRALINGLDQNRLHHAFLFSGTRGVGKTTLARIFAKSLNCEQGVSSTPCGVCQSCTEVDSGRFVDLIEVDAASRTKVDDTRELLDNVQYAPSQGRYKVYLIDEVHMLSTSSFNALLKTLEEPPPHVKFLFATTDPQKLPVTILSRCLQFNLRRLELTQISDHLRYLLEQETIKAEPEALEQLARAADGSMRDALSLLDQAIAFGGGEVTTESVFQMLGSISQDQLILILNALLKQDGKALLAQSAELAALGRDFHVVFDFLLSALQQIATLQLVPDLEPVEANSPQLTELAAQFDPETIQLLYQIALHGKRDLSWAADPKSGFDMTLMRMLSFQPTTPPEVEDEPLKKSPPPRKPVVSSPPASEAMTTKSVSVSTSPAVEQALIEPDIAPKPKIKPDVIAANEPVPIDNTLISVDLSPANWTQIIAELKLSALAHQLAENSALVKCEQQSIYLSLSPELGHLATDNSKQKLQKALSKKLGQDLKLVFADADTTVETGPTLAVERAEQQAVKQQQAFESIHNDPTVEIIKNTFNARIIEHSIKPID